MATNRSAAAKKAWLTRARGIKVPGAAAALRAVVDARNAARKAGVKTHPKYGLTGSYSPATRALHAANLKALKALRKA